MEGLYSELTILGFIWKALTANILFRCQMGTQHKGRVISPHPRYPATPPLRLEDMQKNHSSGFR